MGLSERHKGTSPMSCRPYTLLNKVASGGFYERPYHGGKEERAGPIARQETKSLAFWETAVMRSWGGNSNVEPAGNNQEASAGGRRDIRPRDIRPLQEGGFFRIQTWALWVKEESWCSWQALAWARDPALSAKVHRDFPLQYLTGYHGILLCLLKCCLQRRRGGEKQAELNK